MAALLYRLARAYSTDVVGVLEWSPERFSLNLLAFQAEAERAGRASEKAQPMAVWVLNG